MAEFPVSVAIVGGGVAGLSAAHALAKRGVSFVLFEAASRFGGLVRTDRDSGFLLEAGPDTILAQKPEGIALCREMGLGERLVPTHPEQRTVYVVHRRRLHPLPEGMVLAVPSRFAPLAASRLFSWRGKLRMGLDLVLPGRREASDESVGSFIRRRLGREALERLGEPLLAGIHAGDPDRLSIRSTFPRFVELEARYGSLIRGIWASRPRGGSAPATAFYSLAGGMAELVEAVVARLPASSLRAGAPVRSVGREEAHFIVDLASGARVKARSVIVAAPAPRAAEMLQGLAPEAARSLAAIRFASSATVLLGYRRADVAHPLDGYGLVVPRTEGLRTLALSFVSTKLPGRAPEGHVLLRGFLGGTRDPEALSLEDRALVELVAREMRRLLGIRGEAVLARVYRWPEATPQMEVGHMERVAEMESRLSALPGLFVTGAGIRGAGVPDMVAEGVRVAAEAVAYASR